MGGFYARIARIDESDRGQRISPEDWAVSISFVSEPEMTEDAMREAHAQVLDEALSCSLA